MSICPVPNDQIPLNEYRFVCKSWLISWPQKNKYIFYTRNLMAWLIMTNISYLISSGSNYLKNHLVLLVLISMIEGLSLPLLILTRQWLSWKYIFNRLVSSKIEYEESGWYDGQVWEKPTSWIDKDYIVACHDVKPIIDLLVLTFKVITSIALFGLVLLMLYNKITFK
mgnify:CR=1 FL=1